MPIADTHHKSITGTDLHVFAYAQNTDPGAVGAYIGWVDTSTTPFTLKIRKSDNTGWDLVGGGVFTAIASQLEAEAGSNNTKGMTPLRVAQAIAALTVPDTDALAALTDVDLTGLANGYVLLYDNATSKWKAAPPHSIPVGGSTGQYLTKHSGTDFDTQWSDAPVAALSGDLSGNTGAAVVTGLQGRPVAPIAVPTFLGDEFNGASVDSTLWPRMEGDSDGFNTITESGGRLKYYTVGNSFWKDKAIWGGTAFPITGKTVTYSMPSITVVAGKAIAHFFGVTTSGSTRGGGGANPTDFIGFRLEANSVVKARFEHAGTVYVSNIAVSGSGVNWPTAMRIRDAAGVMYWDVIWAGGTDWTQVYSYDHSALSLGNKVLLIEGGGEQGAVQGFELDYVHTTYAASDPVQAGFALKWNPDNFRFEPAASGMIPTTSGAPVGAPAGVLTGFSQIRIDQATNILYAWNGTAWKSVALS